MYTFENGDQHVGNYSNGEKEGEFNFTGADGTVKKLKYVKGVDQTVPA